MFRPLSALTRIRIEDPEVPEASRIIERQQIPEEPEAPEQPPSNLTRVSVATVAEEAASPQAKRIRIQPRGMALDVEPENQLAQAVCLEASNVIPSRDATALVAPIGGRDRKIWIENLPEAMEFDSIYALDPTIFGLERGKLVAVFNGNRECGDLRYFVPMEQYPVVPFPSETSPPLAVIYPNGRVGTQPGETLNAGDSVTITWEKGGVSPRYAKVKIEAYPGRYKNAQDQALVATVVAETDNDGSYTWTIPKTISPSYEYRIRISATENPFWYDESDGPFTILAPTIEVVYPDPMFLVTDPVTGTQRPIGELKPQWFIIRHGSGTEDPDRETKHRIAWRVTGAVGANVKIELYKKSAADNDYVACSGVDPWPPALIVASTPTSAMRYPADASQFLSWPHGPLTDPPGGAEVLYKVKISDAAEATIYDFSNGPFKFQEEKALVILSPSTKTTLKVGQNQNFDIAWYPQELSGTATIQLWRAAAKVADLGSTGATQGRFLWNVTQAPNTGYTIKIAADGITAESEQFEIVVAARPTISDLVFTPDKPDYDAGNNLTVSWICSGDSTWWKNSSGGLRVWLYRDDPNNRGTPVTVPDWSLGQIAQADVKVGIGQPIATFLPNVTNGQYYISVEAAVGYTDGGGVKSQRPIVIYGFTKISNVAVTPNPAQAGQDKLAVAWVIDGRWTTADQVEINVMSGDTIAFPIGVFKATALTGQSESVIPKNNWGTYYVKVTKIGDPTIYGKSETFTINRPAWSFRSNLYYKDAQGNFVVATGDAHPGVAYYYRWTHSGLPAQTLVTDHYKSQERWQFGRDEFSLSATVDKGEMASSIIFYRPQPVTWYPGRIRYDWDVTLSPYDWFPGVTWSGSFYLAES